MTCPSVQGLELFSRVMDRDTTETLTVVAGNVCICVSRAEVSCHQPLEEDVPILAPASMVALTRVCYASPAGRIAKKKVGGHEPSL